VAFTVPGSAGKADFEYLPNAINVGGNFFSTGDLGQFSLLNSAGYDWYRSSSSTADSGLHPALRILLDADGDLATTGDRGGLVFERAYNGGVVTTNTWTSDSITSSTFLWNFGLGLGFAFNINATPFAYDSNLSDWQAYLPNAKIIGFSSGVGTGWDGFSGAVDNIAWSVGESSSTSNFEVTGDAIPEPSTYALVASALSLAAWFRRRSS